MNSLDRQEFEKKYSKIKKALLEVAVNADVESIDPLEDLCLNEICPTICSRRSSNSLLFRPVLSTSC